MDIQHTRGGIRLSQHGVVVSELRLQPGPTHSIFDILAALIPLLAPPGRLGLLGFAGGGMIPPLRHLGFHHPIDTVDLDAASHRLFHDNCSTWAGHVNWSQGDALAWLQAQPADFSMLIDDLSEPAHGDVFKPAICWDELPRMIRQRLRPEGVALFNLLPNADGSWPAQLRQMTALFPSNRFVHLADFENRIWIAGASLPHSSTLGAALRRSLRTLRSRQASRTRVSRS